MIYGKYVLKLCRQVYKKSDPKKRGTSTFSNCQLLKKASFFSNLNQQVLSIYSKWKNSWQSFTKRKLKCIFLLFEVLVKSPKLYIRTSFKVEVCIQRKKNRIIHATFLPCNGKKESLFRAFYIDAKPDDGWCMIKSKPFHNGVKSFLA